MATKAELQDQINDLRDEIEHLKARLLIAEQQRTPVVAPAPATPWPGMAPWWQQPYTVTWQGVSTSPAVKGQFTINASADADAFKLNASEAARYAASGPGL